MLRKRLIAAVLVVVPMVALIWMDVRQNFGFPGIWLLPTALLVSLLLAGELTAMLRERTPGPISWVVYLGVVLMHFATLAPRLPLDAFATASGWELGQWAWFIILLAAMLHEMWYYEANSAAVIRIALTIFTVMYAGWLMTFLCGIRLILGNAEGALAIFSLLFVIKMSDVGAYFVGKHLGRHKLAPQLSPGKTIEGFWGGLMAAVGAAFLVSFGLEPLVLGYTPPWWIVLGYGVSLMLMGVLGDLAESLVKRNMGCKDSSGWLPGLGGIMDLADSVVMAAPVAYLWWAGGLLGTL